MPNIGPVEIIILLLILLVIFGPRRIPELGRSVGHGLRNFKESVTGRDRGEREGELEPRTSTGREPTTTGTDSADAARGERPAADRSAPERVRPEEDTPPRDHRPAEPSGERRA